MSPKRHRGSPPPTPDLTPAVSLSEEQPPPPPPPVIQHVPRQHIERQQHFDRQDSTEDSDTIEEYVAREFEMK